MPAKAPFAAGSVVVAYLMNPASKVWGLLRSIGPVGVAIEGIELRSFDEAVRGMASGDLGPGDVTLAFYPSARVEKILLDRGTAEVPSLHDQFRARLGVGLKDFLAGRRKRR